MIPLEEEALSFIRTLEHLYMEGRDIARIREALDGRISWIGTGGKVLCAGIEQAGAALAAHGRDYPSALSIVDSRYDAAALGDAACIVYGELRAVAMDTSLAEIRVSLTAVCVRRPEGLRLLHLHVSEANREQAAEPLCGRDKIHGGNEALRALIARTSRALRERNRELEALMENIPGGAQCCRADGAFTIVHVSSGFLSMFGYTRKEIDERFHGEFARMIYPPDADAVRRAVREQLETGPTVELEYRIACKDGRLLWVLDKGRLFIDEDGERSFYCILVDITARKKEQEDLRLSLERHQIIMDQARDIIFEWDIPSDTLTFSSNWMKKFGYPPIREQVSRQIPLSKNIPREDIPSFIHILTSIAAGAPYADTEFRIRNAMGETVWCRIRATAQFDGDGRVLKAVGVILDIQEEKRRQQILLEQAQRDPLTGLYNKGSAKHRVNEYLSRAEPAARHALLIIDVDNFKAVNDGYGHLCGDTVLADFGARLAELFRVSDIVARVGGDEFLVFLPHLTSREIAAAKAEEILRMSREVLPEGDVRLPLSCSVGIALYPADAEDYADLYVCADRALYYIKNNGKSGFAFYGGRECEAHPYDLPPAAGGLAGVSARILDLLYGAVDTGAAIRRALAITGRAFGLSRAYVFESDPDGGRCHPSFVWGGDDVEPDTEALGELSPTGDWHACLACLDENGVFHGRDVRQAYPALNAALHPQDSGAPLQCAILDGGCYRGFIGFDPYRDRPPLSESDRQNLTRIAKLLSVFVGKRRLEDARGPADQRPVL